MWENTIRNCRELVFSNDDRTAEVEARVVAATSLSRCLSSHEIVWENTIRNDCELVFSNDNHTAEAEARVVAATA